MTNLTYKYEKQLSSQLPLFPLHGCLFSLLWLWVLILVPLFPHVDTLLILPGLWLPTLDCPSVEKPCSPSLCLKFLHQALPVFGCPPHSALALMPPAGLFAHVDNLLTQLGFWFPIPGWPPRIVALLTSVRLWFPIWRPSPRLALMLYTGLPCCVGPLWLCPRLMP